MTLEKGKLPEEQGNQSNSNDELLKIMKEMQERINQLEATPQKQIASGNTDVIEAAVAAAVRGAMAASRKDHNYEQGIEEEAVPVDDWVEEGIKFYSPSAGYIVSDDKRKGQIVNAPYKRKIFFNYLATRRQGVGRYEEIAPISLYISNSKKETEWLRNHSLYNVMFYEANKGITHTDAKRAARTAQIMTTVKSYTLDQLIRSCNEYDVPKGDNYEAMKQMLAFKMSEKEIQQEAFIQQKSLEETFKAQQVKGNR
jgi:hypothetical protein